MIQEIFTSLALLPSMSNWLALAVHHQAGCFFFAFFFSSKLTQISSPPPLPMAIWQAKVELWIILDGRTVTIKP